MNDGTMKKLIAALLTIALIVGGYWWMNRGYGEVSREAYEFSKAIYGACLAQSEQRLDKVQQLLDDPSHAELPSHERKWLETIIADARAENWKTASKKARRMMENQAQKADQAPTG